jgi:hypothetical protein
MRRITNEKDKTLRNDLETREIADTELDAVAGGVADVYVGADVVAAVGIHADVAGIATVDANVGIAASAGVSAHV